MADQRAAMMKELVARFDVDGTLPTFTKPANDRAWVLGLDQHVAKATPDEISQHCNFNYLHVERLLPEAAALIDRALADRELYRRYAVDAFNTRLEVQEFLRLKAIHDRETSAGYYLQAKLQVEAESQALEIQKSGLEKQLGHAISGRNLLKKQWKNVSQHRADAAISSAPQSSNVWTYAPWGIRALKPRNHAFHAVKETAHLEYGLLGHSNNLSVQRIEAELSAATKRLVVLKKRMEWENADWKFRQERTQVAEDVAWRKAMASCQPGGVLNYPEKCKQIKARFLLDIGHAFARLVVVAEGMDVLYGFDEPLPESLQTEHALDRLVEWVREAQSWLAAFLSRMHAYVIPVSVRELIGSSAWKAGKQKGTWKIAVEEDWLNNLYSKQSHVRLRGISAFAASKDDAPMGVEVSLPRKKEECYIRHLDGQAYHVRQGHLPTVLLGRVLSRELGYAPDIVGVVSLQNATPYGTWTLKAATEIPDSLSDLFLDLHLSAIRC